MLLVDLLDGAQLLFPCAFERARHEAVFGFDGIILAARPFGLVAGAFAAERPLPFELPALFLQLPHRRDRNPIRGEGVEENAFNERVNG